MPLPELLASVDLADIGVIGGSGFTSLLEGPVQEVSIQTPYGMPSDSLTIGQLGSKRVAFLPRHGAHHRLPPHAINYRANLWAMAQLGVSRIIAPTSAGSLQPGLRRGEFVVCDQFVDRTYGRAQTFFDGPRVVHVSVADPYCPELREQAVRAGRSLDVEMHDQGTVVVVQGPRFSTRAESRWFSQQGWGVVNMTQYPEVVLARELEICYVNISLITDYDAGIEGMPEVASVSTHDVIATMRSNNERVKRLIERMIPQIPEAAACLCSSALSDAVIG